MYLIVNVNTGADGSAANLLQILGAVIRPSFEEELIDGHLQSVLTDFGHRFIADGEE